MAIRNDFTAGEVLAAADLNDTFAAKADYNLPVDVESGTTYTFTLANARQLVTATSASAKTFTIPPQSSVTWAAQSIIRVVNYGAGAMTINGGVGVTVTNTASTLAQFQGAAAIRTAENAWTLVPFSGGVGNADFSDAATGTYTDGGINYKYKTYTGSGTVTITKAGLCDVLVVGSGGGGKVTGLVRSGGGGGGFDERSLTLTTGTKTVTVGAGGATGADGNITELVGDLKCGGGGRAEAFQTSISVYGFDSPASGGNGAAGMFSIHTGGVVLQLPGNGCGGTVFGATRSSGRASLITGSSVSRGAGGAATGAAGAANTGNGGDGGANAGGSGVVIIRVRTN
jgi:hypothetical protein